MRDVFSHFAAKEIEVFQAIQEVTVTELTDRYFENMLRSSVRRQCEVELFVPCKILIYNILYEVYEEDDLNMYNKCKFLRNKSQ
jgi:hypothetical protein